MTNPTTAQRRAQTEFTFTLREMVRSTPQSALPDIIASELTSHLGAEPAEAILSRAAEIARAQR